MCIRDRPSHAPHPRLDKGPAGRHLYQGVAAAPFRELCGRTHARCKGSEGTLSLRRGARTTTRPTPWLAGGGCTHLGSPEGISVCGEVDRFDRLSHVGPSEGCLAVRAVWKAHPDLNPTGIRVKGVMNPGLGSWRLRSESRGLKCSVGILFRMQTVRLPDRIKRGRAE